MLILSTLEGIMPMYYKINIFQTYQRLFFIPADLKIAGKWLVILQGAITFSVLSRLHELGKKCEEFIASEGVPK